MASIEELEKRKEEQINVSFYNSGKYTVRTAKLLTRKIIGVKDDEYELGPWEVAFLAENLVPGCSDDVWLKGDCTEFAFSFNPLRGEDWPYSDCFWKINDGPIRHAEIYMGGKESRQPTICIYVDSNKVVDKCNSPGREIIA